AYKLLGRIYNDRAEFARGFEALRKAKMFDPGDMKVRYQIARALYHLGEPEQAEIQCQLVLSRKPNDPEARDLMALISSGKSEAFHQAFPRGDHGR
ncbi:MAG TPA: tetratricopeptide repeat protein, partial [Candidatus Omnitrophota bacterium]|nr:tetratricopeptide repeat protein [Candidatus Omnitrophota bacterium]